MSHLSNFYHQITGAESSPKLVLLHGLMGFSANWRRIATAFETEYQVLVYDQRGHGRSFQPAEGYGPADYAGDLELILNDLGWDKINLVGHSMGGRAAIQFAHSFSNRLEKLVIEDIGPSMEAAGVSQVTQILDAVPVPFTSKRAAKEWFDTSFLEIFSHLQKKEGLAAYLYANIHENEKKEAVWRFYAPGIRESLAQGRAVDQWEIINSLKIPTLLIRGEHSKDLPLALFQKMLSANPLIEGVEIKDAAHWVHSDQPEIFIESLRRFFQSSLR